VHPENLASLKVAAKCGFKIVDYKVYFGIEILRHQLNRADFLRNARAY